MRSLLKLKKIIPVWTLLLITVVFAGVLYAQTEDSLPPQLYRISNVDRFLLSRIERMGGIVDRYVPGKSADVYLDTALYRVLRGQGLRLEAVLRTEQAIQLSDDHRLGRSYHSYDAVTFILDSLQQLYPHISVLHSLGQTVQGREIWALLLSDYPQWEEGEPELKLVANMHGDEMITQEILLLFADSLLQNYGTDDTIHDFLNNNELWIVPNMNFDGAQRGTRFNANQKDLNRSFPDREWDVYDTPEGREPEVQAIIRWAHNKNFVLSANFHAGALVANYPWDKNIEFPDTYAATPDDATFRRLALAYASRNTHMFDSPYFSNGITNGAMWYEVSGSMQDWNYNWPGCMDITLEISENKMPPVTDIRTVWNQNRTAMFSYLRQINYGIHGLVSNARTSAPLSAEILIDPPGTTISSDPDQGDFYRILQAGTYDLRVSSYGFQTKYLTGITVDSVQMVYLPVQLEPLDHYELSGTVRDSVDLEPLSGAAVQIFQDDVLIDSMRTDMNGRFSLSLAEGAYHIVIEHEGYLTHDETVILDQPADLLFNLKPWLPGSISGQIRLADGGRIHDAVVWARGISDTLNENGTFHLHQVPAGAVSVFGFQNGYRSTRIDSFLKPADSLSLDIILERGTNAFALDFENDSVFFIPTGDWMFGASDASGPGAHSGEQLWATNLNGDYGEYAHRATLKSELFSIQGLIEPTLEFYHWFAFEENYDGGNIKISIDEGKSWQVVHPLPDYNITALPALYGNPLGGQPAFSGASNGWQQVRVNLTPYMDSPIIRLCFDGGFDEQKTDLGWYIDDVRLFDDNAVNLAGYEEPRESVENIALNIHPNPANPQTSIQCIPVRSGPLKLSIFNIRGRLIDSRSFSTHAGQEVNWIWKGANNDGHPAASGIYLLRADDGHRQIHKRIVLIR